MQTTTSPAPSTHQPKIDVNTLVGRRASNRWERTSVGDLLERVRWSYPNKPAIIGCAGAFGNERWSTLTYESADILANQIAHSLLEHGLTRGDRLLFFCENSIEAFITKIGAAKAGVICAPVNVRLGTEVQDYLYDAIEPAAIIADAELLPSASSTIHNSALPKILIPIGEHTEQGNWIRFDDWIEGKPTTEPEVQIHSDDIWQIMFTSGTTSMPKGVMVSHLNSYMAAFSFSMTHSRGLRHESELTICTMLPAIYHAADQCHCFPAFLTGGTLLLGRSSKSEDIAAAITEHKATATFVGSAQMLDELIEAAERRPEEYDLKSMTSFLWAWGALPPATFKKIKERYGDVQVVGILGQTESTASTRFWPDLYIDAYQAASPKVNHVGRPSPLLAAALMSADGTIIDPGAAGVTGEIVYRSPALTPGYYNEEGATTTAVSGGWFHSGDSCQYDDRGILVSVDRYKDMIKSGGENIPSQRIESVLATHPSVQRAAVVGLPHSKWGEAVTGLVILNDESASERELIEHCRTQLGRFEVPKRILVVAELPVSVGGKLRKHVIREQYSEVYADTDS